MKNFYLHNKFSEYDEFRQIIQGWNLDFLQLDRGEFDAGVLQASIGQALFSYGRFNRSFDQRGSAPSAMWTFALFSERSTPIIWHERECSNNTMIIYRPGFEIDCVSRPGFEVYTLSYTEKHLDAICAELGLPGIKKLVQNSDYGHFSIEDLESGRRVVQNIVDSLTTDPFSINNKNLAFSLEQDIPENILSILSRSSPAPQARPSKRSNAVRRIKKYLAEYSHDPVSISALCSIAQVSERTLQYAFKEHYGVSPKSYLKHFRLNGVRKCILHRNSDKTKVNEIANNWGFWHMGQFAADYRKLFGELPSATLQNSKL